MRRIPQGDKHTNVSLIIRDGRGRIVAILDLAGQRAELFTKSGESKESGKLQHTPRITKRK